jgi:hypothetical protein
MIHAIANATDETARAQGREVAALLVAAGAVPDLDRFGPEVRARLSADAALLQALGI